MITIMIIAAVILLVFWLAFTITYFMDAKIDGPKIKFKSFIKFYTINPDRWDLYDFFVACKTRRADKGFNSDEFFHFGYFDWFRYVLWMRNTDKREQKIKNAKATANMLSMVKQDIEKNEAKAKAEVSKGIDDLQRILNNLSGGTKI